MKNYADRTECKDLPTNSDQLTVALLGCGPSGMSFMHHLSEKKKKLDPSSPEYAKLPVVTCFEQADVPGGLWRDRKEEDNQDPECPIMYDDLWINGPKELIEFYDYTFMDHFKQPTSMFITRKDNLSYITARNSADGALDGVKYNHTILSVKFIEEMEKFEVVVKNNIDSTVLTSHFDRCIWAMGFNGTPKRAKAIDTLCDRDGFKGKLIHSVQSGQPDFEDHVKGKRVVLIGDNLSAEDLAYRCVKLGVEAVYVCTRSGMGQASNVETWPSQKVEIIGALPLQIINGTDVECQRYTWDTESEKYVVVAGEDSEEIFEQDKLHRLQKKHLKREKVVVSENNSNCWTSVYDEYDWDDLPTRTKAAAKLIGYSKRIWNNDGDTAYSEFDWDELTGEQQDAAKLLGYTKDQWDTDEESSCSSSVVSSVKSSTILLEDINTIIMCTGYNPNLGVLSSDLRIEMQTDNILPGNWKMSNNLLSADFGDISPARVLKFMSGTCGVHLISNPRMMYVQSWDTDIPLFEIDVYAYVALAYCCGDIETPSQDEMYKRCKKVINDSMDNPYHRYEADPAYNAQICQIFERDYGHKGEDHWLDDSHDERNDKISIDGMDLMCRELAQDMKRVNHPVDFGTYEELSPLGEQFRDILHFSDKTRIDVPPAGTPESRWCTYRDMTDSTCRSLYTGTAPVPLKDKWINIHDNTSLSN